MASDPETKDQSAVSGQRKNISINLLGGLRCLLQSRCGNPTHLYLFSDPSGQETHDCQTPTFDVSDWDHLVAEQLLMYFSLASGYNLSQDILRRSAILAGIHRAAHTLSDQATDVCIIYSQITAKQNLQ